MTQKEINSIIANTIYQQMGGNRFAMMTGVKSLIIENGIRFTLSNVVNDIKWIKIVYKRGVDLYEMQFIRHVKKKNKKLSFEGYTVWDESTEIVSDYKNIYADQLEEIFRKETGLVTRL